MQAWRRWLTIAGAAVVAVASGCADPFQMDPGGTQTVRAATWPPKANLVGARVEGDWVVAGSERVGWVADRESGFGGARSGWEANEPQRATPGHGSHICWYLLTIRNSTGQVVSVEFLGCFPLGGTSCDDEQRRIANEYQNRSWVRGRAAPACTDIEKNGAGTANFSWAELNGYFGNGNPHDGYGWVQQSLKTGLEGLRAAWGRSPLRRANGYPATIWLSSGYRCPHGNASIRGASTSSYHMEGRAADIETRSLARVPLVPYSQMTATQKSELHAVYRELTRLSEATNIDWQPWDRYKRDRHFHFAH